MLCKKCLNLFENGPKMEDLAEPTLNAYLIKDSPRDGQPLSRVNDRPWRIHHAQEVDIQRSVEEGCIICKAIWEHIDRHFLSRDEDWSQPFVLQCPPSDVEEAISAHAAIVWSFRISWKKGGTSSSFLDFYLIPGWFSPSPKSSHSLTRW
jgi:hypothetical protein